MYLDLLGLWWVGSWYLEGNFLFFGRAHCTGSDALASAAVGLSAPVLLGCTRSTSAAIPHAKGKGIRTSVRCGSPPVCHPVRIRPLLRALMSVYANKFANNTHTVCHPVRIRPLLRALMSVYANKFANNTHTICHPVRIRTLLRALMSVYANKFANNTHTVCHPVRIRTLLRALMSV
jgi:hypothetical protein